MFKSFSLAGSGRMSIFFFSTLRFEVKFYLIFNFDFEMCFHDLVQ